MAKKTAALGDVVILDGKGALRGSVPIRKGEMKTPLNDYVPGIDELEVKAIELSNLMISRCEHRVRKVTVFPDGEATTLSYAALAAQSSIKTFLALERILPNI